MLFNNNQSTPCYGGNKMHNNSNYRPCSNCGANQNLPGADATKNCKCHKQSSPGCCCGCVDKSNKCSCDVDGGVF